MIENDVKNDTIRFIKQHRNIDYLSKEQILELVKVERIEFLNSHKDLKNSKPKENDTNKDIDMRISILEEIYNTSLTKNKADNTGFVCWLYYLYYIFMLGYNRICNLSILDSTDLRGKPKEEVLKILEKIQNIKSSDHIEKLLNTNIEQNVKNEILNYKTYLTAKEVKLKNNAGIDTEKTVNKLEFLHKRINKISSELEANSTLPENKYIKNFFDWFENDIYDIWHNGKQKDLNLDNDIVTYILNRKFSRLDKKDSIFGLATKKCENFIKNLKFSLFERKLLILINWLYISNKDKESESYYLPSLNLNSYLFNAEENTLSTVNSKKIFEAIDRLNQKMIYWDLSNSWISKKIERENITGFEHIAHIDILYDSKLHKSNNEGISKQIKGFIFNFNKFNKLRYQISQIDNLPIRFLEDSDYSLILAENIIHKIRVKQSNKISIRDILKELYIYDKELTPLSENLFSHIQTDSKNTNKRLTRFFDILDYVLEGIKEVKVDISDIYLINSNEQKIEKNIKFKDIRLNNIFIKFEKINDETEEENI